MSTKKMESTVQLTASDGQQREIKVSRVTDSSIIGEFVSGDLTGVEIEIPFGDIKEAKLKEVSVGKTAAATGGSLVGLYAVLLLIAFAQYGCCF